MNEYFLKNALLLIIPRGGGRHSTGVLEGLGLDLNWNQFICPGEMRDTMKKKEKKECKHLTDL